LGHSVQSGDYSGSVMLGAFATATTNGQLALGSINHPIGPVSTALSASSTHALNVNLNGNIYQIMLISGSI
jgi:hypothetical protein